MANLFIKLDKDDIKTSMIGESYLISCKNDISVILTKEAFEELCSDYMQLIKEKNVSKNQELPPESKI